MGSRPRHPNKDIEAAVQKAEAEGWQVSITNGHAWARLRCPKHDRSGCQISVWSTPRNSVNHARDIIRAINKCECGGE